MRRASRTQGFTVIELLVVIIVVCMLGMFVALGYSGVQARNRNNSRQTSIDFLKTQLESYYAQTNMYPTLGNLNDPAWRAQNLKRVTSSTVQDPRWNKSVKGCTSAEQATFAATPAADCYSYQVTGSDGGACDDIKTPCAHYTVTATLEGGEKYVKTSLN